jgi:hypothetical protein
MTRTLPLIAMLATGCIIYEDRKDGRDDVAAAPEEDPDAEQEPVDEPGEEPDATGLLALTVNEAVPGALLLSTLVPLDPEVDVTSVHSVVFERDVQVLDTLTRPYELVLLLSVAPQAPLGEVAVTVESTQGSGYVLDEPFRIVEAADGSAGTPGTTGCP